MKLVLDACVWRGATASLEAAGHDVVWVGDWPTDPGDDEILAFAQAEGRVLVTLDKDFGELAVLRCQAHHGIIRLVGISATRQGPVATEIVRRYSAELASSALITADPGRVRIRSKQVKD